MRLHLLEHPVRDRVRELRRWRRLGLVDRLGLRASGLAPAAAVDHFVRRISLHVQAVALPAIHEWLVHDRHPGTDRDPVEDRGDVLGIHADATVARAQPDTRRLVGPVDEVARPPEVHGIRAEGIVRTRRHPRGQRVALLRVLLAHRRRRRPPRILALRNDLGRTDRRGPAHLADADRERHHDALLACGRLRKIEQPQGRDVDDDALVRRIGQNELGRQEDARAFAGQPDVDARVRARDLVEAQVETPRDVGNRVLLPREGHLQLADHAGGLRVVRKRVRGERRQQLRLHLLGRSRRGLLRLEDAATAEREEQPDARNPADGRDLHTTHGITQLDLPRSHASTGHRTTGRFGNSSASRWPGRDG